MFCRIVQVSKAIRSSLMYSRNVSEMLTKRGYSSILSKTDDVKTTGVEVGTTPDTPECKEPAGTTKTNDHKEMEIIDVDIDQMIMDEDYFPDYKAPPIRPNIITPPSSGASLAPIDIDPWVDESLSTEGTVQFDDVNKTETEKITYPEPPKDRLGYYETKGLKVWLPKRLLSPATFRYTKDIDSHEFIDDDMRICRFEKSINESDATTTTTITTTPTQ